MKPNATMLLAVLGISFVMFVGGFGGAAYLVIKNTPTEQPKTEEHQAEEYVEEELAPFSDVPDIYHAQRIARELDEWQRELKDKEEEQLKRDQKLVHRENILQAERDALDKKRSEIETLQKEVEVELARLESLKKERERKTENAEMMAQLYAQMRAEQAVNFLRQYSDEEVSRLLFFLPDKQAVKILQKWSSNYPAEQEQQRLARITASIGKTVERQEEPLTQ